MAKKAQNMGNSTVTVNFVLERETKGAVRYQEVDANGNVIVDPLAVAVGTIYFRKSGLVAAGIWKAGTNLPSKVSAPFTFKD